MIKVLTLVRNLSVIGLIVMIVSIAFSSFAEEITLTTIMPTQTTAALGGYGVEGKSCGWYSRWH